MNDRESGKRKSRPRVSHRKELAVVTLAMIASVSGVGGLLASNHLATANTAQATNTGQHAAKSSPARTDGWDHTKIVPASWHGRGERDDEEGRHAPARQVKARPVQHTSPSFALRSNTSASTVSQGS